MARDRIGNRATKTVLLQRQRGEPVDATVPLGPAFAQRDIEAIDRAGPARQRTVLERLLARSEEHTSELQSLMRISYAVFCLKKKKQKTRTSYDDSINHNIYIQR